MFAGTALYVRLLVYAGLSLFIIGGPYVYMVVCVVYAYNLTPRRAKMITVGLHVSACIYNIPYLFISIVTGNQCIGDAVGDVITKVYT